MYRLLFLLLTSPLYSQHIEYKTYDTLVQTEGGITTTIEGPFTLALIHTDSINHQFRITSKSNLYINLHAKMFAKSEDCLFYFVNHQASIYICDGRLIFNDDEYHVTRTFTEKGYDIKK